MPASDLKIAVTALAASLYGSTTPLGPIETAPAGGLYEVRTRDAEVGVRLRGVTLKAKQSGGVARVVPAEFVEAEARVQTAP